MSCRLTLALAWLICLCVQPYLYSDEQKKAPDEEFKEASVWSGVQEGDERKPRTPQAKEHPAHLRVVERDGERFVAEYAVNAPNERRALRLEGVVRKGKITAKTTKILRGSNWENGILEAVWTGEVSGKQLVLQRESDRNLVRTARLTLNEKEDPSGPGRRKNSEG